METVDIDGFGLTAVDVYTTAGSEFTVRRSADGDRLSFAFDQSSLDSFLVRSDSPTFVLNDNGFDLAVDFPTDSGNIHATFDAFAPVPEPSAAAALAGAALLTLRRRRRTR